MRDEMGRYWAKNSSKCVSIYLDGYLQSNIYIYLGQSKSSCGGMVILQRGLR